MDWEWQFVREQSTKSFAFPSVLPSGSNYGGRYASDDEEPLIEYTFRAEGVPADYLSTIRSAFMARRTKWSLTDKLNNTHTGYVTGYDFQNVSGCDRFTVEVQMTVIPTELTS